MIMRTMIVLVSLVTLGATNSTWADTKPQDTVKYPQPDSPKKTNTAAVNKDVNTNITINEVVTSGQANIDLNVRFINAMEAMQTSKKGVEKTAQLEKKRKELGEELKKQEQKWTQSMQDFKTKESTMSTVARNAEETKLVKMRHEIEAQIKASEEELKLAYEQTTSELAADVEKAVAEIAQANEYDIVQDVYTGRTLYASKSAMITEDIIKTMNQHEAPPQVAPTKPTSVTKTTA